MFPRDPMEGAYPDPEDREGPEPTRCDDCGDLATVFLWCDGAHHFCVPCEHAFLTSNTLQRLLERC